MSVSCDIWGTAGAEDNGGLMSMKSNCDGMVSQWSSDQLYYDEDHSHEEILGMNKMENEIQDQSSLFVRFH